MLICRSPRCDFPIFVARHPNPECAVVVTLSAKSVAILTVMLGFKRHTDGVPDKASVDSKASFFECRVDFDQFCFRFFVTFSHHAHHRKSGHLAWFGHFVQVDECGVVPTRSRICWSDLGVNRATEPTREGEEM